MALRHPVDAVYLLFYQPCQQLDYRDARVVYVVVGPPRSEAGDKRSRFFDQVGPGAGVEVW
jgi:hypothetical protein